MKQWTALAAKIGGLELSDSPLDIQAADMRLLTSDFAHPFTRSDEAGNSNPESVLISPLPQFTSILPGTFSDLRPLPDVGNDPEAFHEHSPTCTSSDHPVSCSCVEIPPFPEMPSFAFPSRSRRPSFIGSPDSGSERDDDISSPATPTTPGNRDTLYYRISRSSSRSRASSRSRPPSQLPSRAPSRYPSRAPSPRRSVSSMQAYSRIPSPSEEDFSPSVTPPAPVISRLHELMETPSLSSSLPNMTSYFPSSFTRDSRRSPQRIHGSRSPSRSRSTSLHTPPQPIAQQGRGAYSSAANSTQPIPIVKPSSSFEPSSGSSSGPVSSASTAAMVLERAQREQRARQRAEREHEKHREREKLEKEREKSEREHSQVDERPRGHQKTASSSQSPSHREPIKVYSNTPVHSDYSSHRSHSSRLGSSASRDYNAHKHMTKAIPVPRTAKA